MKFILGNFKTWKNRFFTLREGRLTYYEKEDPNAQNKGFKDKLGELYLQGYKVVEKDANNLVLENEYDKSSRKLLIRHADENFIQVWKSNLSMHIEYCDYTAKVEAI